MAALPDLTALPPPDVIEPLDFEQLYAALRADLVGRHPASAEVVALESEPLTKLMQAFAYRELLYRQRVNQAARSNLLAFATKADLDHKGAFYGLPRIDGEIDERYRLRIQLRIAALAASGTAEHYRLIALGTSLNVRDAAVHQPMPGRVGVVLWLQDTAAAAETLALAEAALNAPGARPVGVPVSVSLAVPRPLRVVAQLWREPSAPSDLVAQITSAFTAALDSHAQLGRDLARSWVTARLHVAGVARVQYPLVDAPPVNTPLASNEYPTLALLQLTDEGTA